MVSKSGDEWAKRQSSGLTNEPQKIVDHESNESNESNEFSLPIHAFVIRKIREIRGCSPVWRDAESRRPDEVAFTLCYVNRGFLCGCPTKKVNVDRQSACPSAARSIKLKRLRRSVPWNPYTAFERSVSVQRTINPSVKSRDSLLFVSS